MTPNDHEPATPSCQGTVPKLSPACRAVDRPGCPAERAAALGAEAGGCTSATARDRLRETLTLV